MDIATFNRAKQAYGAQRWDTAVILFSQCGTGPGTGEACHLCGNALMRLGRVQEAVQAYRAATADVEYRNQGAVYTNLGKAQMALGDLRGAIDSLRHALSDATYQGAYKAYIALGEAYSKMGDARNAGVAFRKAALEDNNPDPAKSLINLGVCFMQLRRPADAVEAYRTAIDFSTSDEERCLLNANLGQAYVASNRMLEAVQAFETAMSGGYQLSPAARADYERALQTTSGAGRGPAPQAGVPMGAQDMAGYGGQQGYDPLDPAGSSGELLPSPDSSGFFVIPESELIANAKASGRGGSGHVGLKVLIVALALVVVAAGLAVFAYMRGYGIPSQEASVSAVLDAAERGTDAASSWASSVDAAARTQAMASVQTGDGYGIAGLDSSAGDSVAIVDVELPEGGTLSYRVSLVREGIGWKVSDIEQVVRAESDETYASAMGDPVGASADAASTDAAADPNAAAADPNAATADPNASTADAGTADPNAAAA